MLTQRECFVFASLYLYWICEKRIFQKGKDDKALLLHGTQTPWSAEHHGSYTTFFHEMS